MERNELTITHDNGNSTTYKLINSEDKDKPIAYHKETSEAVIRVLEQCRKSRTRIVLDLGDVETGRSWGEINDITGYVGLSRGTNALYPILVYNARSMGGGSILDHCIVAIYASKGGKLLYRNEKYAGKS